MIALAILVDTIHRHFTRVLAGLKDRGRTILLIINIVDNHPLLGSDAVSELAIIAGAQEVLITALVILIFAGAGLEEGAASNSKVRAVRGKRVVRHCSEVQQMISFYQFHSFFALILYYFTNIRKK
jgi:hypothetical protein